MAIPLSVVFIKYFPDIGRYYISWTWQPAYCGITYEKNTLGQVAVICLIFLFWDLVQNRDDGKKMARADFLGRVLLLAMSSWLIIKSESATALVSALISVTMVIFMRTQYAREHIRQLGRGSLVFVALLLLLFLTPGLLDGIVSMVGRDMTLTGRTDLWEDLLKHPFNPLLGTGYQSFWLGPRAQIFWDKYDFHPNQAHNGYLETYINQGLLGLGLLLAFIGNAFRNLRSGLTIGSPSAILHLSLICLAVFSNWTEANFNRLSLIWIITLIVALHGTEAWQTMTEKAQATANQLKSCLSPQKPGLQHRKVP